MRCLLAIVTILLSSLGVGCGAPYLSARIETPMRYAIPGPQVRLEPIADARAERQLVTIGYRGMFQTRYEVEASEDTPPAGVVAQTIVSDLASRGLAPGNGGYRMACQMPQFLIRFRGGPFGGADVWGYMDLHCTVQASGAVVWQGPLYSRVHRTFSTLGQVGKGHLEDDIWPVITGVLVQQAVAALNRAVFHLPPAPEVIAQANAWLVSPDADDRTRGLYLLGISGNRASVPVILQAAADPDPTIRWFAVEALGTLGAAEALPTLLHRYASEEGAVQWAILESILRMGDPRGFEWLRQNQAAITADTLEEIADDVLRHPVPVAATPP